MSLLRTWLLKALIGKRPIVANVTVRGEIQSGGTEKTDAEAPPGLIWRCIFTTDRRQEGT